METKIAYETQDLPAKVPFPAKLILSAKRFDCRTQQERIVAFADGVTLNSDGELFARISAYRAMVAAGGLPYIYSLAELHRVDEVIAQRLEELQLGLHLV